LSISWNLDIYTIMLPEPKGQNSSQVRQRQSSRAKTNCGLISGPVFL
jgi:hypothetical protein